MLTARRSVSCPRSAGARRQPVGGRQLELAALLWLAIDEERGLGLGKEPRRLVGDRNVIPADGVSVVVFSGGGGQGCAWRVCGVGVGVGQATSGRP